MIMGKPDLIELIKTQASEKNISNQIALLESDQQKDFKLSSDLLAGVWELQWSNSKQPWLKQTAWLDNLQVLDPINGRACNLLRFKGYLGSVAGISVQANIKAIGERRIKVLFLRGGWVGPKLPGGKRLKLLRDIKQNFPAWLDITFIDNDLRICRGNAGTTFILIKRNDLQILEFF